MTQHHSARSLPHEHNKGRTVLGILAIFGILFWLGLFIFGPWVIFIGSMVFIVFGTAVLITILTTAEKRKQNGVDSTDDYKLMAAAYIIGIVGLLALGGAGFSTSCFSSSHPQNKRLIYEYASMFLSSLRPIRTFFVHLVQNHDYFHLPGA